MHADQMISAHPAVRDTADEALLRCIELCYDCAQVCTSCADACLGEEMVARLRQCIRVNLDCADLCLAAGTVATRRTGSNGTILIETLNACLIACRVCGDECERHASQHEHCRICAETCRRCEAACTEAIRSVRSLH